MTTEKPEINELEAAELIKGMGREAVVVAHDNGKVTATAIYSTQLDAAGQQRIRDEVDGMLQQVQQKYRIVKKKKK